MDNEELDGVKFSEFPSQTPGNSDEVVGLHSGDNARFSIANIVAAVRNGLANIFVPLTRTINGKGLSTDIFLDSSDIDYDNTESGLTADNVQDALDELAQGGGGGGSAADITYDPTISGASATNVQDALDEAFGDLDDKQDTITASGILKGDGAGGVSAAVAGTDYATPAQLSDKAAKADLTSIQATGSTNTTGSTIPALTYFYLNGTLVQSKMDILPNASFTNGTNYSPVTAGGLNDLARCFYSNLLNPSGFEIGGWGDTDPGQTPRKISINIRARYAGGPMSPNTLYRVMPPSSMSVGCLQLNSYGVVVADTGWMTGGLTTFTSHSSAASFVLTLKYNDDRTVTDLTLAKTTLMDLRYYV